MCSLWLFRRDQSSKHEKFDLLELSIPEENIGIQLKCNQQFSR